MNPYHDARGRFCSAGGANSIGGINREGDGFKVTQDGESIVIEKAECKGEGASPLWDYLNGNYPNADKISIDCKNQAFDSEMTLQLERNGESKEMTITPVWALDGDRIVPAHYKTEVLLETEEKWFRDVSVVDPQSDFGKEIGMYWKLRELNKRSV